MQENETVVIEEIRGIAEVEESLAGGDVGASISRETLGRDAS